MQWIYTCSDTCTYTHTPTTYCISLSQRQSLHPSCTSACSFDQCRPWLCTQSRCDEIHWSRLIDFVGGKVKEITWQARYSTLLSADGVYLTCCSSISETVNFMKKFLTWGKGNNSLTYTAKYICGLNNTMCRTCHSGKAAWIFVLQYHFDCTTVKVKWWHSQY